MALDRRTLLLACATTLAAPAAFAQGTPNKLFSDSRLIEKPRFSVEVVGRGEDLIFIPGLMSSRTVWRVDAERLRSRYRLHLIQVAGFAGESARSNASGEVLLPTADTIGAYIDEARLTSVKVIGHSLGGTSALRLAQTKPQAVERILLADALPFYAGVMGFNDQAITGIRAQLQANGIRPMAPAQLEASIQSMSARPEEVARIRGWAQTSHDIAVARFFLENAVLDQRPGLAAMRTPVTLVHPAPPAGPNVPPGLNNTYALALADAPNKTLIRIDNSMHFVMLDQPQAFSRAVDQFLSS